MRLDKFTVKAQEALQAAQSMADQHDHQAIEPEHLLVALLEQREGVVGPVLAKLGARPEAIRRELQAALGKLATVKGASGHYLGERTRQALDRAQAEAERLKDEYVSTEHLLLALAQERDGAAGRVLTANGVGAEAIYKALVEIRGTQRVTDPNPEEKYQALQRYSRDLTDLARRGKLDPVIGRDEEIRRVIQVLSRRTKNNPVLIGEPGVGKPAMARGELRCVGATTLDEYRKHIEKDAALERRFQPVMVREPSVEDTIAILRGLKDKYEVHHKVKIKDTALVAAAVLSHRYIADRFLPDKAIDLVDEAAARIRMQIDSMPQEIDEIERRVMQLQIERVSVAREEDAVSRERLAKIDAELAELREKGDGLKARWQAEKDGITRIGKIKEEIETTRHAMADAERRARSGLADPNRPIGSFLFLGPTGVGKTELARALAEFLFDDERAIIRIDMSEYMEKHTVARLIGAPPGYVGYDEGGQLTEAVRRPPYAVVPFDQIEKAHADVFNVLLQLLDDGRLTDGHGRTVDFTNSVLIMTSNLPVDPLEFFKPEFVNRIDEIVRFRALDRADMSAIVGIQLSHLAKRLASRRLTLEVSPEAEIWLAERGYDPA